MNRTRVLKRRDYRFRCRQTWASIAIGAGLIAGCVDQQKEIAKYRAVIDATQPAPVKPDYSQGQPLTLEEALILANVGYEQLDIQGEAYLQSLIERDRSYSTFMPTISIVPTYAWADQRSGSGSGAATGGGSGGGGSSSGAVVGTSRGYTTFQAPIIAQANLFNGFRDVAAIRAAHANADEYRYLLLDFQQTILLETAQSYYQVLLAERSVEVLTNSVKFQDARVADMRGRLRAGIAQPLDLAQSEALAASTRANLVTAQNNVTTARYTLALMTNANVEKAKLVDRLYVPEELLSLDTAVQDAQRDRPDIKADEAAVRVARENVKSAIGEYYPSISLNLAYYLHRDSFPTNLEWSSLLVLNFPVFSAGTIQADVRTAWSKLRQSLYQEWLLIRQVQHDVKSAWQTTDSSRRRIIELRTEVAASQEALRQSTQRYGVGLAINLDVLNAQDTLLTSQLDLATEEFNRKIYYLDLLRSLGRLAPPTTSDALATGPATRPATQETAPIVPAYEIPPMTLPSTTQPTTVPSGGM
jgi:outer membrane protein